MMRKLTDTKDDCDAKSDYDPEEFGEDFASRSVIIRIAC